MMMFRSCISLLLTYSFLLSPSYGVGEGKNGTVFQDETNQQKQQSSSIQQKKPFVGTSDFKEFVEKSGTFVDKTLFIKDIIDSENKAILITRPRRWGKSLNLSMLKYFFNREVDQDGKPLTEQPHRVLFAGGTIKLDVTGEKEIKPSKLSTLPDWEGKYSKYQGKYPVIHLSFKDIKENSYEKFESALRNQISATFSQHSYIYNYLHDARKNSQIKPNEREEAHSNFEKFQRLYSNQGSGASEKDLGDSLRFLSELLHKHHGRKAYVLIDEYDTPIHASYMAGYHKDALGLMRGVFGSVLKDNTSLERGILTGILRIAKADLFSGLNNFVEDSVFSAKYPQHYGFTEEEVTSLLESSGIRDVQGVRDWYNGYSIGGKTIYNPWSVMSYLSDAGREDALRPHWVSTGGVDLIRQVMIGDSVQKQVMLFLGKEENGEYLSRPLEIQKDFVFSTLQEKDKDFIWSLLLYTGYLTAKEIKHSEYGMSLKARIPNKEVASQYRSFMIDWIQSKGLEPLSLPKMDLESRGDFEEKFGGLIKKASPKIEDFNEDIFHGLISARFLIVEDKNAKHFVSSEMYVNDGRGRYDNVFFPIKGKSTKAVLHEYKFSAKGEDIKSLLDQAWWQICIGGYLDGILQKKDKFPHLEEAIVRPVVILKDQDGNINVHVDEEILTMPQAERVLSFFKSLEKEGAIKKNQKKILDKNGVNNVKDLVNKVKGNYSTRKFQNDNLGYVGFHEGRSVRFREHRITNDGDCGFHGLGIDRKKALEQLSSTNDPDVIEMVADDMFEAAVGNDFAPFRNDATLASHVVNYQQSSTEENRLKLRSSLLRPEIYQAFIKDYIGNGGWLSYVRGGRGVLNALARINRVNVHVWTDDIERRNILNLIHSATQEGSLNTVHLLHTQNMRHFNLLEEYMGDTYQSGVLQDLVQTSLQKTFGFSKYRKMQEPLIKISAFEDIDEKLQAQRDYYYLSGIMFESLRRQQGHVPGYGVLGTMRFQNNNVFFLWKYVRLLGKFR